MPGRSSAVTEGGPTLALWAWESCLGERLSPEGQEEGCGGGRMGNGQFWAQGA